MTKPGCLQYPECSCPRDFYCIEGERKRGCWPAVAIMVVMWLAIAWLFLWAPGPAHAHSWFAAERWTKALAGGVVAE